MTAGAFGRDCQQGINDPPYAVCCIGGIILSEKGNARVPVNKGRGRVGAASLPKRKLRGDQTVSTQFFCGQFSDSAMR